MTDEGEITDEVDREPTQERQTEHEYETVEMEEVRCPECGNESDITQTKTISGQPIPPEQAGECGECGYNDHPITFHSEWKWEQMSEEEREEAREKAERQAGRITAFEESAAGIAQRRES